MQINNTNDIIKIYTKDIINKNKQDKNVYFNNNILICSLKPNHYLYINNIKINANYGYIDNKYSLGSYNYEIINTDFNIPSLNNNIKDFRIELITNGVAAAVPQPAVVTVALYVPGVETEIV